MIEMMKKSLIVLNLLKRERKARLRGARHQKKEGEALERKELKVGNRLRARVAIVTVRVEKDVKVVKVKESKKKKVKVEERVLRKLPMMNQMMMAKEKRKELNLKEVIQKVREERMMEKIVSMAKIKKRLKVRKVERVMIVKTVRKVTTITRVVKEARIRMMELGLNPKAKKDIKKKQNLIKAERTKEDQNHRKVKKKNLRKEARVKRKKKKKEEVSRKVNLSKRNRKRMRKEKVVRSNQKIQLKIN